MNNKNQLIAYFVVFALGIGSGFFISSFISPSMTGEQISQIGPYAPAPPAKEEGEFKGGESSAERQNSKSKTTSSRPRIARQDSELAAKFTNLQKYASQQTVDKFIRRKFADQSDEEIVYFLKNYMNIDHSDLPEGVSAVDYAARLGQIFTDTSGVDSPEKESQGEKVEFDVATNQDYQAMTPKEEFTPSDNKIYASFNTDNYDKKKVMVKWYRMDDPKVYVFDQYPITSDKSNNYVWLEKPGGWGEGNYGVEIYSTESNLDLMASGQYAVVSN